MDRSSSNATGLWVAGVDGCPAGWALVRRHLETGEIGAELHADAASLLARSPALWVMAVDIPIGLPEVGRRACDTEARRRLGPQRGRSVFPAPIRPALAAATRAEASQVGRAIDGRGVGAQAWGIYAKVRDMDAALAALARSSRGARTRSRAVREVHPELSFWAMNGERPLAASKHSEEGGALRRRLVAASFGARAFDAVRRACPRRAAKDDDLLDAFAALWSAERIHRGEAVTLPSDPPRDAHGLRMEIVY